LKEKDSEGKHRQSSGKMGRKRKKKGNERKEMKKKKGKKERKKKKKKRREKKEKKEKKKGKKTKQKEKKRTKEIQKGCIFGVLFAPFFSFQNLHPLTSLESQIIFDIPVPAVPLRKYVKSDLFKVEF